MNRAAVIIPAAGRSERLGLKTPKPFILLAGVPMLARAVEVFERNRKISLIQPVLPQPQISLFTNRLLKNSSWKKCLPPVPGGPERQDSVFLGLCALPEDVEIVLVHDAARPFISGSLISRVVNAAVEYGAALSAIPLQDTLKKSSPSNRVERTLDRRDLWLAQTPQAFRADLLREAHDDARRVGFLGTDDAALVERLGHPVHLVGGSALNIKITTRDDLVMARALLMRGLRGICKSGEFT